MRGLLLRPRKELEQQLFRDFFEEMMLDNYSDFLPADAMAWEPGQRLRLPSRTISSIDQK
jgi:hypothetical protein